MFVFGTIAVVCCRCVSLLPASEGTGSTKSQEKGTEETKSRKNNGGGEDGKKRTEKKREIQDGGANLLSRCRVKLKNDIISLFISLSLSLSLPPPLCLA
jgi:hypothetical protein